METQLIVCGVLIAVIVSLIPFVVFGGFEDDR